MTKTYLILIAIFCEVAGTIASASLLKNFTKIVPTAILV